MSEPDVHLAYVTAQHFDAALLQTSADSSYAFQLFTAVFFNLTVRRIIFMASK